MLFPVYMALRDRARYALKATCLKEFTGYIYLKSLRAVHFIPLGNKLKTDENPSRPKVTIEIQFLIRALMIEQESEGRETVVGSVCIWDN